MKAVSKVVKTACARLQESPQDTKRREIADNLGLVLKHFDDPVAEEAVRALLTETIAALNAAWKPPQG